MFCFKLVLVVRTCALKTQSLDSRRHYCRWRVQCGCWPENGHPLNGYSFHQKKLASETRGRRLFVLEKRQTRCTCSSGPHATRTRAFDTLIVIAALFFRKKKQAHVLLITFPNGHATWCAACYSSLTQQQTPQALNHLSRNCVSKCDSSNTFLDAGYSSVRPPLQVRVHHATLIVATSFPDAQNVSTF